VFRLLWCGCRVVYVSRPIGLFSLLSKDALLPCCTIVLWTGLSDPYDQTTAHDRFRKAASTEERLSWRQIKRHYSCFAGLHEL
jgi:hypothetical protein